MDKGAVDANKMTANWGGLGRPSSAVASDSAKEKGGVIAIDKDANTPEGGTATPDTKATPIHWMGSRATRI